MSAIQKYKDEVKKLQVELQKAREQIDFMGAECLDDCAIIRALLVLDLLRGPEKVAFRSQLFDKYPQIADMWETIQKEDSLQAEAVLSLQREVEE